MAPTEVASSAVQHAVQLLLHLQQRGRITTAEAAEVLGVDRRQARRVLKRLADCAPVEHRGVGRGREWVLDPVDGAADLALYDRIALRVGRDATRFLDGTPLAETLARASTMDKVPHYLSRHVDLKLRLKPEPTWRPENRTEVMHELLDGLFRERLLKLCYQARSGLRVFEDFRAFTLVAYRRALYLMGAVHDDPDGIVYRLRVDRIQQVEVGPQFEYPEDWNPDLHLERWFGIEASGEIEEVLLDFGEHAASLVHERLWHPTQVLEPLEDGGVRLRMNTGGRELVRFVLEWGEHCTVVRPDWLRDEVVRAMTASLAQYGISVGETPR